MLLIPFRSEDFPESSPVRNQFDYLEVTWSDILWAAMTVGRPNLHYVFKHGESSIYEILFRFSLMRMALQQRAPGSRRIQRTAAAKGLDPSEKGAVNYFLGLNMCKLFSDKCLGIQFMLHLDVFRAYLNPTILSGRSRPDLVGRLPNGNWIALESKGRVSVPDRKTRTKAKEQAEKLEFIQGTPIQYKIGAITFFNNDVLNFYWIDPPGEIEPEDDGKKPKKGFAFSFPEELPKREYFNQIADLLSVRRVQDIGNESIIDMPEADLRIRINSVLANLIRANKWSEAYQFCTDPKMAAALKSSGLHGDGLGVEAGKSWSLPYRPQGEAEFSFE